MLPEPPFHSRRIVYICDECGQSASSDLFATFGVYVLPCGHDVLKLARRFPTFRQSAHEWLRRRATASL